MVTPGVPPIPHVGGPIIGPGAPTVLICNMPAAVMGDMCTCVGPPSTIVLGSMGVLIMNKPAARMGDLCAHGGTIVMGAPTVLIGEMSPGAGGAPVMAGMMSAIGKSLGAVIESLAGGLDEPAMGGMLSGVAQALAAGAAQGTPAGLLGGLGRAMADGMKGMVAGFEPQHPGLGTMAAGILGMTQAMSSAAEAGTGLIEKCGK